jgi:hypothetical protein
MGWVPSKVKLLKGTERVLVRTLQTTTKMQLTKVEAVEDTGPLGDVERRIRLCPDVGYPVVLKAEEEIWIFQREQEPKPDTDLKVGDVVQFTKEGKVEVTKTKERSAYQLGWDAGIEAVEKRVLAASITDAVAVPWLKKVFAELKEQG